MRIHILLLLAACDHVDSSETPIMPDASADLAEPLMSVAHELDVPSREETFEPDRRVRFEELRRPPTDEPKAYAAWLQALSVDERADITTYCSRHPLDYLRVCGGIGRLHIPVAPRVFRMMNGAIAGHSHSYFRTFKAWRRSLSVDQLAEYVRICESWIPNYAGIGPPDYPSSDLCGPNTPLVIAFNDEPIAYTTGGAFAFRPDAADATDWPTATTPWLVLDRDGDGSITSGRELFGSNTWLANGGRAANGFRALAELDSDGNGRIDRDDVAFAQLQLWADVNADQRSTPNELRPASDIIVSLSLASHVEDRCDDRGNCERERANIVWRDASSALHTGSVVDVYLPARPRTYRRD